MGLKYILDANVVIELVGGQLPVTSEEWLEEVIYQNEHCVSVIVKIEILGFDGPVEEMSLMRDFSRQTISIPLTDEITDKTIEVRKSTKIKLPDAIIAATALVYDLTLVTRNTKDFDKIEDLKLLNPHDK